MSKILIKIGKKKKNCWKENRWKKKQNRLRPKKGDKLLPNHLLVSRIYLLCISEVELPLPKGHIGEAGFLAFLNFQLQLFTTQSAFKLLV